MYFKCVLLVVITAWVSFCSDVQTAFGQLLDAEAAKSRAQEYMLEFLLLQSEQQERFACVVVSDETTQRLNGSIFIAAGKTLIASDEKKAFRRHDVEIVPIAVTSDLVPTIFQRVYKDGKLQVSTSRDQANWQKAVTYEKDEISPKPQYPIIDPLTLSVAYGDAFSTNKVGRDGAAKMYTSLTLVSASQKDDILSSLWKPRTQAHEELRHGDFEHVVEFSSKQNNLPIRVTSNVGFRQKDGSVLRVPISITQTIWIESSGKYAPKRVTLSGRDLSNTKTYERVFDIHWLDEKTVVKFMEQENLKLVGGGVFENF